MNYRGREPLIPFKSLHSLPDSDTAKKDKRAKITFFDSAQRVDNSCTFVHHYCNIRAAQAVTSAAESLMLGECTESCAVSSSSHSSNLEVLFTHGYIQPEASKVLFL